MTDKEQQEHTLHQSAEEACQQDENIVARVLNKGILPILFGCDEDNNSRNSHLRRSRQTSKNFVF